MRGGRRRDTRWSTGFAIPSSERMQSRSARRSIDAIAATLCGRSDQTDYLRGEIGKEAPQLMTNTSIRMLRCGATVSWPSGCWWSADGIGFAHP